MQKRTGGEKKMTETILRKKIHSMIDTMPDHFIQAMMPLITCMAEEYWKPVLEPASPEEIATVEARLKDYEKDPSSFIPLEDIQ
jgi:hypothetical protein